MEAPRLIAWRDRDRRYLLLAGVLVFVLAALVTVLYVAFSVLAVDGDSMAPALRDTDRVLLTRGYDAPRRGDIIAFDAQDAAGRRVPLIKRVVALPGDSVEIIGDSAWVNGELSLVAPTAHVGTSAVRFGPIVVPEGSVYVLGDNRPVSLDSRFIGPIPIDTITGRAVAVILPVFRIRAID